MSIDEKIAHLGFIQGVINRMGSNAFLVKGWTIALVAAVFVLSAKDSDSEFIFLAVPLIFLFWLWDTYYLRQEKLYRKLFEKVADNSISSGFFTMDTTQISDQVPSLLCVSISKSIFPFYSLILVLLIIFLIKNEGANFSISWKSPQKIQTKVPKKNLGAHPVQPGETSPQR